MVINGYKWLYKELYKEVHKLYINKLYIMDTYDTLVLSGSSCKGLLILGALQYLTDNFQLKDINKFVGTSAGSMICYFLAIGYTPIELMVYICTHQIMEKMQHLNIVSMMNGTGACSFSGIQEQLEKMTINKIGKLITLGDLKTKFGKDLTCITHNLSANKTEYLSAETYPDMPCLVAIRMSSNLPLFFEKYQYNDSFYIDGGVSDNFGIDIGDRIGNKVIGINIQEKIDFKEEMNIIEYMYLLLYVPISHNIQNKKNSSKSKIINLSYADIKFFNFHIDSRTKLEMFSSGYNQIREQVL